MKKLLYAMFSVTLLTACATQPLKPDISVNTLQDATYPCIKVVFPDVVKYDSMQQFSNDNESVLLYRLKMNAKPQYDITIMKRHTSSPSPEWSLVPISDQYNDTIKFYDIPPNDIHMDRSAAVALIEKDNQIYLRGVVGEYTGPNTIYMIISDRIVQKEAYLHLFSTEKWKESSAGKRIIGDMAKQVDWYYEHTEVMDCNTRPNADTLWWE